VGKASGTFCQTSLWEGCHLHPAVSQHPTETVFHRSTLLPGAQNVQTSGDWAASPLGAEMASKPQVLPTNLEFRARWLPSQNVCVLPRKQEQSAAVHGVQTDLIFPAVARPTVVHVSASRLQN
jgi:hypothetical protein